MTETCDHVGAPTWRIAGALLCAICDAYLGDDPNQRLGSLDAAWAEAEGALPPDAVIRMGRSGGRQTRGWATAYLHGECIGVEFADTLPAALRALTAKLRADR